MHYGIELVPFGDFSDPRAAVHVAQAAEAAGWEGIWIWDHMLFPYGTADPWVTLAAIASTTHHLKLITGVAPLPRYRPHLLARMLTALDLLSAGRVIFGTGLGIAADFIPFGEPGDDKTRAAMMNEGLNVLAGLWSGQTFTYHGTYYTADAVRLVPTPVQQPRIPIWIGGDSPAALRRAAQWDGWITGAISEQGEITRPPQQLAEQVAYIRRYRSNDAAFDVAVDGISAPHDGALVHEYARAGATWWFECIFGLRGTMEELLRRINAGPPC